MSNITLNIVEPSSPTPINPVDPGTGTAVPDTGLFTSGIGGAEAAIIATVSLVVILAIVGAIIYHKKKAKQGSATSLFTKCKQTLKSNKHASIGLAVLALLVSIGTVAGLLRLGVNAIDSEETGSTEAQDNTAALTVTAESEELTIELADEPVFAVLPVEVTVAEATEAGYTLTAYAEDTNLVSTTDSSKVIPMVTVDEAELVALTDNTYGLSLVEPGNQTDEIYTALSTDSSSPTIIKSMPEYTPTEEDDTTTIYYGFYITPDVPYGTYTNNSEVHYNATINTTLVTFDGNDLYFNNDTEQTTNEVEYIAVAQEESEGTINQIISGEYLVPGQALPYIFLGWSEDPEATTPTYTTAEDIAQNLPIAPNTPITLYAIWQKATTITFDANDGTGDKTTQTIIAGEPDNLNPNEFVREGYTFIGWNTVATPTEQEPGKAYADQAEYTAPAISQNITLYAQWKLPPVIGDLTDMQDFATLTEEDRASVLNSMTQGQQYQLEDSRDQKNYYVSKLADNKIWMTQNLDLDLSTSTELTPANTNISSNWTPSSSTIAIEGTSVPGWQDSNYVPYSADPGPLYVYSSGTTSNDEQYTSLEACKEVHSDCSAKNHVGNYYNWSAAVANNNTAEITEPYTNVETSICPAGWRLPTGTDGDFTAASREWNAVLYAEGVASSPTGDGYTSGGFNKIRTAPLWLARSGSVELGSLYSAGDSGFYWSSTVNSSIAYGLGFDSGIVNPANNGGRNIGISVRCVAQ